MVVELENDINLNLDTIQEGTIKVHSQIINDLSSGIYSSPASCIKELVNNSYDADASKVIIRIKPINDTIILVDDGNGMNAIDFDNNFAWISKSNKRNRGEVSQKFNRPLIGKIGIGFIAVNEICNSMRVISSKKGEDVKFIADIDFDKIIESNEEDKIIKGTYKLINEEEEVDEHYTIIELIDLKESIKDILSDKQYHSELARRKNKDFDNSSFRSMKAILESQKQEKIKTFKKKNAYVNFILDLASYIPVEYIEGAPIVGHNDKIISEIVNKHKELNFKVDLDGIELKKPIYFTPSPEQPYACASFNEKIPLKNGDSDTFIEVKGYFFSYDKLLTPRELNGVSIKIKGIPIAAEFGYDTTFMAYPNHVDQIFRNWVSGEIYVEKGLEEAMNIDRKSFRITHPHYLALQNFLHQYLRENFFSKDVQAIYEKNKKKRAEKKKEIDRIKKEKILNSDEVIVSLVRNTNGNSSKVNSSNIPISTNPISLKSNGNQSTVEINQKYKNQFKKSDWINLEDIFIIFEKSYNESTGDIGVMKNLFYKYVADLKKK